MKAQVIDGGTPSVTANGENQVLCRIGDFVLLSICPLSYAGEIGNILIINGEGLEAWLVKSKRITS